MSIYAIKADTFFLPTRVAHGGYLMVEDGVFGAYVTDEPDCEILDLAGKQVAPGFVETDMTASLPDDVRAAYIDAIPLKRLGTPQDIADAVAFLASPGAGYITGQVIAVNGGMYC